MDQIKDGKPVLVNAIASANSGMDAIEHIWSVGYTSIMDPDKRRQLAVDRTAGRSRFLKPTRTPADGRFGPDPLEEIRPG